MTAEEKNRIKELRDEGLGYKAIAMELGISANTVSSYCRRNGLNSVGKKNHCLNCGLYVEQSPKRKQKKFCSDKCRMQWWNNHPEKMEKRSVHKYKCQCCGKSFNRYDSAIRKYCSHKCYIKDRFGRIPYEH